jgi:protein-tyrosine phosphatase
MIDIHHHLLFGIDDGPRDFESSIAQAEAAIKDGITHVVCTPHSNHRYDFDPARNQELRAAIEKRIDGRLTLGLGCDMHLSPVNIEAVLRNPTRFSINNGRYLLVEFADYMIPRDINDTFYEFTYKGIVPIITHPERNPIIEENPEKMIDWLRTGCLLQITAASLEGRFGNRAQTRSWDLLHKNWVHFIATDAHNLDGRAPVMSSAFAAISRRMGEATANRLCRDNPLAAFENRALPEQPAPEGVDEGQPVKRRGLLARLMRK